MNPMDVLFVVLVACAMIWRRELARAIQDAIDNFRGGPPAGPHPSPANDGALLRRHAHRRDA
jgi:hypothetical protein